MFPSRRLGPSWRGGRGLQGFPLSPERSHEAGWGLQEGWCGRYGATFGLISGVEQVPAQPKVSSHAAEGLGNGGHGGEPRWGHSMGGKGIPQDMWGAVMAVLSPLQ